MAELPERNTQLAKHSYYSLPELNTGFSTESCARLAGRGLGLTGRDGHYVVQLLAEQIGCNNPAASCGGQKHAAWT